MQPMSRDEAQLDSLFASLAEQVKLPLIQIRHAAELSGTQSDQTDVIDATAQAALRLIDGYLLSVRLQQEGALNLEPVSVSSLLYDTADELNGYAALHGCEIELAIGGKYEPVMAERRVLKAALLSLGYGFIGAAGTQESGRRTIKLSARRQNGQIAAGIYGANEGISADLIKRARLIAGRAHQALPGFSSDSGAGVLIADRLLAKLETNMRPSRMGEFRGLAAVFSPSRQLSLV